MMILGSTVLSWTLTVAIDGTILAACVVTMFFALRGTQAWLRRREVGNFATGVVIFVTFCGLFVGAWLPVGLILGARSLLRRTRASS